MKYYIKTFGCKLNHSDTALIEKMLAEGSHVKVDDIDSADFIIFNTCAVVDSTTEKIIKEVKGIKGKKIILGGCLPATLTEECKQIADGFFSPTNIDDINEIVEKVIQKGKCYLIRNNNIDKAKLLKNPRKKIINIIPISEGCLGSCTYCLTRLAREKLTSFAIDDIVLRIKEITGKLCPEIQLTSQDLAVFGLDRGSQQLPALLSKIKALEGDFQVKLGMMNPGWTIKIIDSILEELKSNHYYKFLHLPLQSGDDYLLSKMNRGYKTVDFLEIVHRFRTEFPDSVLATDIIVGHPLETEEMFENTIKIIEETKPDIIHIFKFSSRPGTADEKLKDLPDRIKKDRSRIITKIFHRINEERNQGYIGRNVKVLIIEKRNNAYLCRNDAGRAIVIKNRELELGKWLDVKIINAFWNYLEGIPAN